MKKLDVKKIVDAMKAASKSKKEVVKSPTINKVASSGVRVRDMRQESMDIGAHGAHEYFSDKGVSDK